MLQNLHHWLWYKPDKKRLSILTVIPEPFTHTVVLRRLQDRVIVARGDTFFNPPLEVRAPVQKWGGQREPIPATWVRCVWIGSCRRVRSQLGRLPVVQPQQGKSHTAPREVAAYLADVEQHLGVRHTYIKVLCKTRRPNCMIPWCTHDISAMFHANFDVRVKSPKPKQNHVPGSWLL